MGVLYCAWCKTAVVLSVWGVVPCEKCGSRTFSNVPPNYGQGKRPRDITVNDRRFLRSLRIAAEDDWFMSEPKESKDP
jgi:DNA-directed RNA polymerase subunit RPC12/RpoP